MIISKLTITLSDSTVYIFSPDIAQELRDLIDFALTFKARTEKGGARTTDYDPITQEFKVSNLAAAG